MNYLQHSNLIKLSTQLKDTVKSTAEKDEALNILLNINAIIREKSSYTQQEYTHFAGPSGSLIKVLECSECNYQCHIESSKALHHLTFVPTDVINQAKLSNTPLFPPEVTASVQRLVISILKEQCLPSSNFPTLEYMKLIMSCLSILYNLVVCAPEEVLGSIILNASHPFVFYRLPGIKEPKFFEDGDQTNVLEDHQLKEMGGDHSTRAYTNRNRRKRLRRKKAQPSRSTLQSDSPSHSPQERVAFVPRTPPSPQSLSTLSLKPQWIQRGSGGTDNVVKDPLPSFPSSENKNELSKGFSAMKVNDSGPSDQIPSTAPQTRPLSSLYSSEKSKPSSNFHHLENDTLEYDTEKTAIEAKIRNCALHTINAVIDKAGRQNKFGFWPQLMCQNPTIMTSILRDPSPVVRMGALQVINTFLIDSQQVLSLAVDDEGSASYSTLGRQIGSSIRELHRCLTLALLSEKGSASLVRILKTFEVLVENVKYANLRPGLLTKVVTHVKYFLRYKEALVRANAFSVMVSILMVKPPQLPEIRDLLTKYLSPAPRSLLTPPVVRPPSPFEEELPGEEEDAQQGFTSEESFSSDSCADDGHATGGTLVSWLVQRCLDSLLLQKREAVQGIYVQVQLQSLKVLSALVREHLSLIQSSLPLIQHVITVCCEMKPREQRLEEDMETSLYSAHQESNLISPDPDVVVEHSFLLLGALLGSVKSQLEKSKTSNSAQDSNGSCVTPQLALQLWLWTLQHPLSNLMQYGVASSHSSAKNTSSVERGELSKMDVGGTLKPIVAAANVLSHLCLHVLESMGETLLNQVLRTVQFLLQNREFPLQICGIRVMAIIVSYPPVEGNPLGPLLALATVDITTNLLSLKNVAVNKDRLLASWAIANVFSELSSYRETARECGSEELVPKALLVRVIRASIAGCRDKEKIKPHAVRCLGYAIASLSPDLVSCPDVEEEVSRATETLIECSTRGSNMRMRWNACHAIGNILSSEHLPIEKAPWRSSVLVNLSYLVERFQNYKVRIQACIALCGLGRRECFGVEFSTVWSSILKGFEDAQNITDYQEIQHRDELINQLCVGLCHLICLIKLEDFESVTETLLLHQDTVKVLLKKAHESLPPEHASCILKAAERIQQLNNSDVLTAIQTQGLNALLEVFGNFV